MRCLGHALGSDVFCSEFYVDAAERTVALVEEITKVVDYGNPISIQTAYLQLLVLRRMVHDGGDGARGCRSLCVC